MFQNLKMDIVYYKTNTDFEMEFNLCGCCRMRLLTDKVIERKTMLQGLSKAVSRSNIIMITGPLFDKDGIINIVATAISYKTTLLDNKTYGVKSDDEITVIDNSTPLVTPDGLFGGCIIESGPQTIILVTDSKSVRKTLMNTLIHPYLQDVYFSEFKENVPLNKESQPLEQAVISESEEIESEEINEPETENLSIEGIFEDDENMQTEIPEIDEEYPSDEVILSQGMIFEEENEFFNKIPEEKQEDEVLIDLLDVDKENNNSENLDSNDFYPNNDDKFNIEEKKKPVSINLFILITIIFLLIAFAILCYCILYVPSKEGMSAVEYIRETFNILFGKV